MKKIEESEQIEPGMTQKKSYSVLRRLVKNQKSKNPDIIISSIFEGDKLEFVSCFVNLNLQNENQKLVFKKFCDKRYEQIKADLEIVDPFQAAAKLVERGEKAKEVLFKYLQKLKQF